MHMSQVKKTKWIWKLKVLRNPPKIRLCSIQVLAKLVKWYRQLLQKMLMQMLDETNHALVDLVTSSKNVTVLQVN